MIDNNQYFQFFPCCKIVKGKHRDAIYDFQREEYYLVPHSLTEIIEKSSIHSWKELTAKYMGEGKTLESYLDFLLEKELGNFGTRIDGIEELNEGFQPGSTITNAILDFDSKTAYDLPCVIRELDDLGCEYAELRHYDSVSPMYLENVLRLFDDTGFRGIEILMPYQEGYDLGYVTGAVKKFPRLRKITFHGSPQPMESVYIHDEVCVIYTTQQITDESSCGVVDEWYMLPKIELYMESQFRNTCLNRKVGIDRKGFIKNCPSLEKHYGKAGETRLGVVVNDPSFQRLWTITKDKIEGCRDCELRHMCQDCRAYISDKDNIYSRPLKCGYTQSNNLTQS